jgi:hypothetical protein
VHHVRALKDLNPKGASNNPNGPCGWLPAAARPYSSAASAMRASTTTDAQHGNHDKHGKAACGENRTSSLGRDRPKRTRIAAPRGRPTSPSGGFGKGPTEKDPNHGHLASGLPVLRALKGGHEVDNARALACNIQLQWCCWRVVRSWAEWPDDQDGVASPSPRRRCLLDSTSKFRAGLAGRDLGVDALALRASAFGARDAATSSLPPWRVPRRTMVTAPPQGPKG